MNFHVMTLFPDMIMDGLNTSITGRAIKSGVMSVTAHDIRDYSNDKHLKVDDYPYGGGAGMVMRAGPVCDCYEDIVKNIGERPRVIYMTPQGYTFTQKMAEDFAKEDNLVILCGHYEGIDERALENIVTDYVSIGDYVLTGGELPAMVFQDWFRESLIMRNQLKRRVFQMGCLSIRNTQDRPTIMDNWFLKYFCQDIMPILKNGDMRSRLKERKSTDRICMKNMLRNILMSSDDIGRVTINYKTGV